MYFRVILSAACLFISVNLAFAAPFAYIANSSDNTLSVIDMENNGYTKKLSLCSGTCPNPGLMPYGVTVSKDGSRVYVSNQKNNSISVIDALTDPYNPTVIITLTDPSLSTPSGIAINPAGTRLYVANIGNGTVSVFDTSGTTPVFVKTIGVGTAPVGVAVHPAGTFVYVTNSGSDNFSVIDTTLNNGGSVVHTWPAGANPMGVAVKFDGTYVNLYVVNRGSGTVTVKNPDNGGLYTTVNVGSFPFGVALSPDSKKAYVTNSGYAASETISVIDTTAPYLVTSIPLGTGLAPSGIAVAPNGATIYAANNLGSSVSVVNTINGAVTTTLINVPGDPDLSFFFNSPVSLGNFIGPTLFTLTSAAGSDGKITLQGSSTPITSKTVAAGSNLTYNIQPDTNYRINDVNVDGISIMANDPLKQQQVLIFQGLNASWAFDGISRPHSITATFIKLFDYISVVRRGGSGTTGTVTSTTPLLNLLNCGGGGLCDLAVEYGTSVTLTANPANGKYFAGWGDYLSANNKADDVCSGMNPVCTFTMSGYAQPTANFSDTAVSDKVMKVSPIYYYSTLQGCFNTLTSAATEVKTTIETFATETLNLNMAGAVLTLRGGYLDQSYNTRGTAPSIYTGTLTITNGTLIADNIAIK